MAEPSDNHDALACLEFSSIARGLRTLDAIAKRAPVRLRHHGRHSGPKFIILFDGDVASVEESYDEALAESRGGVVGDMFLPSVHPQLWDLLDGELYEASDDALIFVELASVSQTIQTMDYCLKLIESWIVDAQFASGIDGRGYFALQAPLHDVEYCESELRIRLSPTELAGLEVVPRPHDDLLAALGHAPVFNAHW